MTPEREAEVRTIAHDLIGTCDHEPEDYITEWTSEELALFDEIVFRCTGCDWWCSQDECYDIEDQWYCKQCHDETCDEEDCEHQ